MTGSLCLTGGAVEQLKESGISRYKEKMLLGMLLMRGLKWI